MINFMNSVTIKPLTQKTTFLIILTTMLLATLWANPAHAREKVIPEQPVVIVPTKPIRGLDNIDVEVDGEHLVFGSEKDVEEFLTLIINKNERFIDSVEASLGYVSLRTAENRAIDSGETDQVIVEDRYFSTVLGSDGMVQIGDVVNLVTLDNVYSVEADKSELLETIGNDDVARSKKANINSQVNVEPREDEAKVSVSCKNFNKKHRLCGTTTRVKLKLFGISFSSVEGTTSAHKKKCFIVCWWGTEKIDQVGLNGTFDLTCHVAVIGRCFGNPSDTVSHSKNNVRAVVKVYHWGIGTGDDTCIEGSATTTHTGTRNGKSVSFKTDDSWTCPNS